MENTEIGHSLVVTADTPGGKGVPGSQHTTFIMCIHRLLHGYRHLCSGGTGLGALRNGDVIRFTTSQTGGHTFMHCHRQQTGNKAIPQCFTHLQDGGISKGVYGAS